MFARLNDWNSMRTLLILICALLILPLSLAQSGLKAGETGVKIEIEGRGDVVLRLYTKEAPKTTAHILRLVRQGFYDGHRFHRVEKTPKPFLVQVGDPNSKTGDLSGNGGSGAKIAYEDSGFRHIAGAVGLGHAVGDRDSGDSQFYMLLDQSTFLDGNYTVFGQVVSGMDVLRRIERGDRITRVTIVSG